MKNVIRMPIYDKNYREISAGDTGTFEIKGLGIGNFVCYENEICGELYLRVEGQSEPYPLHLYPKRTDIVIEVNNPL